MNNQTIENHLRLSVNYNTSYKTPPCVTQFRLQSHTIIHTKIHPHALIHKTSPRKSAICISIPLFTYFYHHHTQIFCHNIHKKSSQFLKIWRFGHAILPKRPDGDTPDNLQLHLVEYSCLLLICTTVHLFCNILQNNLSPCMHHYSI